MVALNVDSDGFRRTGDLVDLAGTLLGADFEDPTPVPACASDPASEAIMPTSTHAMNGYSGTYAPDPNRPPTPPSAMNDTATGYETEDAAAAGNYTQFGGGSTAGAAPAATMSVPEVGHGGAGAACRPLIPSPTSAVPTEKPWPGSWKPAPAPPRPSPPRRGWPPWLPEPRPPTPAW